MYILVWVKLKRDTSTAYIKYIFFFLSKNIESIIIKAFRKRCLCNKLKVDYHRPQHIPSISRHRSISRAFTFIHFKWKLQKRPVQSFPLQSMLPFWHWININCKVPVWHFHMHVEEYKVNFIPQYFFFIYPKDYASENARLIKPGTLQMMMHCLPFFSISNSIIYI